MKTRNIPGWIRDESNEIIKQYAAERVPENGNVLELGCCFGFTTETISTAIPDSAQIFVIDLWMSLPLEMLQRLKSSNPGCEVVMQQMIEQCMDESYHGQPNAMLPADTFYDWWKYFTKDLNNVTHFRDFTEGVDINEVPDLDLIFQDAQHDYDGVLGELKHWWPKLKPNGILIMDDYYKEWPGVIKAADEFFGYTKHSNLYSKPNGNGLLIVEKLI